MKIYITICQMDEDRTQSRGKRAKRIKARNTCWKRLIIQTAITNRKSSFHKEARGVGNNVENSKEKVRNWRDVFMVVEWSGRKSYDGQRESIGEKVSDLWVNTELKRGPECLEYRVG